MALELWRVTKTGRAKLSENDVRLIRRYVWKEGWSYEQVRQSFFRHLTRETIARVARRETFIDVPDAVPEGEVEVDVQEFFDKHRAENQAIFDEIKKVKRADSMLRELEELPPALVAKAREFGADIPPSPLDEGDEK